jgi:hypothetical protein
LGLVTTLHCVPFQCSVSVRGIKPLSFWKPTAQMELPVTAATPFSA